ncbi:MAG: hypothetical protein ACHQDD_07865 [Steroidobacterales bacterium]
MTDISVIREQLARGTEFRGYGPAALAATGTLALVVAGAQALWLKDPAAHVYLYVSLWVVTAAVSLFVIGMETIQRSRRAHGDLAVPMLQSAVEQFLPAIVAGGLLTLALLRVAPQSLWMLPGLWQIVFSLGVFASCRFLPRPMFIAGVWYLACGLGCLALISPEQRFSPWVMGVPYGVGQLLVARILQRNLPDCGDDE